MKPEDLIPCVTQIPLTYGDSGAQVSPEIIVLIHKAIVDAFGGFSPLGTIKGGAWFDEVEGREVIEDQLRIEVWVPRSEVSAFQELVRRIGAETKQKQMFVIIPEARVSRLDIQETDTSGFGS